jgi:hypothetical protein
MPGVGRVSVLFANKAASRARTQRSRSNGAYVRSEETQPDDQAPTPGGDLVKQAWRIVMRMTVEQRRELTMSDTDRLETNAHGR